MSRSKLTAVSDLIQRVLMVAPKHFTVEYSINPWMGGVVDKTKANRQWEELKRSIEKEGVKVLTLEQCIYPNFATRKERANSNITRNGLKENGFELLGEDYPEYFEGGGDCVFSDYGTLWAGFGQRTSKQAYNAVSSLGKFETLLCELVHPNFYHLDTCFCPVGADSALWFPPAFSKMTQEKILKRLPKAIAVSEKEASAFVCNAITIRKRVISPIGVSENTRDALKESGYNVTEVDMSEFMKSGGACQCLVLKL
ncbi:amidinotransferase domain-containing protein [Ditylenchus destructor]|nr:amidinotransferase domain-containing protein [Ditylenchus destructor]